MQRNLNLTFEKQISKRLFSRNLFSNGITQTKKLFIYENHYIKQENVGQNNN